MRRTKIVCTIGPTSESYEALESLVEAGMDIARLNSSHSDIPELQTRLAMVRSVSKRLDRHIGVMLDLAGPKIRIGDMAEVRALNPVGLSI